MLFTLIVAVHFIILCIYSYRHISSQSYPPEPRRSAAHPGRSKFTYVVLSRRFSFRLKRHDTIYTCNDTVCFRLYSYFWLTIKIILLYVILCPYCRVNVSIINLSVKIICLGVSLMSYCEKNGTATTHHQLSYICI